MNIEDKETEKLERKYKVGEYIPFGGGRNPPSVWTNEVGVIEYEGMKLRYTTRFVEWTRGFPDKSITIHGVIDDKFQELSGKKPRKRLLRGMRKSLVEFLSNKLKGKGYEIIIADWSSDDELEDENDESLVSP